MLDRKTKIKKIDAVKLRSRKKTKNKEFVKTSRYKGGGDGTGAPLTTKTTTTKKTRTRKNDF